MSKAQDRETVRNTQICQGVRAGTHVMKEISRALRARTQPEK
jgi:hypothetical protein